MATKAKALIGFARMKDDELMVAATTIIGAMTTNPHFTTPTPALDDVQGLLDDFTAKLAAARKRGSPEDTAIKDESKEPLTLALQQLAYYVNSVAQGKLSVLLSSGFATTAPATASLVPLPVQGLKASDGRQSGQVRIDFLAQKRVLLYEYSYRKVTVPTQAWGERMVTTSSRGNIIAPLEVGEWYEFRVRAVNTQGPGDWSQMATILVR
ncbi:hypothetical protein [Sphingobacterium sp. SYP-B4668]|uniref:hypothetical protein n=1 Tax=Sphingobacterium sp. SYP-B4668 TaxID=2996035 RepID=UPI0022DE6CBC|nr:hypothetical protein [Sphingobacterium sp. SYP-B4668]